MNFIPPKTYDRGKRLRGTNCTGDVSLQVSSEPETTALQAMRRDLRQSLPDLGSSNEKRKSHRHVRSHSLASARPKSADLSRPCASHRTREGATKRNPRGNFPGLSDPKASTIHQHYYPEGGWGWIVLFCALLMDMVASTVHLSVGFLVLEIRKHFQLTQDSLEPVLVATASTAISLLFSPLVVALSKRQSVRLLAMLGSLLISLSSLFTSFATQLHQLYLSYCLLGGLGESLVRDTAAAIFGQYFKRRRHQVEIIFLAGYGLGIATLPLLFNHWMRSSGWMRGLQILVGMQAVTCFVAFLYRPASLYHPQRRAILHIKSLQKRSKTAVPKEKRKFLDFAVLNSKTVQILILGAAIISFGMSAPFALVIEEMERDGLDLNSICKVQVSLGLAVSVGAIAFGLLASKNNAQCVIAKQYLCQATALLLSGWFAAYPTLNGFHGYVLYVWVYGVCYGGYMYSLKICIFEKVRARNYARTWSFLMWSQALSSFIGISVIYHFNHILGSKRGYYISSATLFLGSMSFFFIDVHKNNIRKKKQLELEQNAEALLQKSTTSRPSQDTVLEIVMRKGFSDIRKAQELTYVSEEILVDNCIEDYYIEDCITSCNKEEKYLMLSEFENNLFKSESLEKDRDCPKEFERDNDPLNYCKTCFRIGNCRTGKLYSPGKTVRNIDIIDEVTSL